MVMRTRPEPRWSQKQGSPSRSHMGGRGPSIWAIFCCLHRHSIRKLHRERSSQAARTEASLQQGVPVSQAAAWPDVLQHGPPFSFLQSWTVSAISTYALQWLWWRGLRVDWAYCICGDERILGIAQVYHGMFLGKMSKFSSVVRGAG